MKGDPYDLLGVARDADDRAIKSAFRRVARELHPDVNRDDPETEERFKEVAEAYEILSDSERRAVFDRYGHEGLSSRGYAPGFEGFGSFSDIFDAFFGGGGGDAFGGRTGARAGGDVAVAVEVSLEEAVRGKSVEVEYEVVAPCECCHGNRAEPGTPIETCERCGGAGQLRAVSQTAFGQLVRAQACPTCAGEGKVATEPCTHCAGRGRMATARRLSVDIPLGIADEQRIRITGRGHAGDRGGPAGDLYVLVHVAADERFLRDGNDLLTVVDVPTHAAALGTRVTVPTLEGEEEVEVRSGTQPGAVVTLRGKGVPSLRGGRRGDQRVLINLVTPRNLSAEQRELLERFAATVHGGNLTDGEEDRSVFARVKRAFR